MIELSRLEPLPLFWRDTVKESHLDIMGHMNVRHYMALFDEAVWYFFTSFGMDGDYYKAGDGGAFALQHFIRYLAEVHVGEDVSVRARVLGRSEKRIHFMLFLVNETRENLAATMEVLGSHADLATRRTSPFPEAIAARIDEVAEEHRRLDWAAPVCGVISP